MNNKRFSHTFTHVFDPNVRKDKDMDLSLALQTFESYGFELVGAIYNDKLSYTTLFFKMPIDDSTEKS